MLVDKDGNPITEPMAPEAVEALINDSVEKHKTELSELQKKLEENTNAGLRKKTEATEKEKQELTKQIDSLKSSMVKATKDSVISQIASNDPKLKEKIESAYQRLKPTDETDQEAVRAAVLDAYKLAADIPTGNAFQQYRGGFGGGSNPSGASDADSIFSPDLKEMGKKFGLSDEDYKKYANKIPKQYR